MKIGKIFYSNYDFGNGFGYLYFDN